MSARKRVRVKVTPTPDQQDRARAHMVLQRKLQKAYEQRDVRAGEYRRLPNYPPPPGGYYGSGRSQNS